MSLFTSPSEKTEVQIIWCGAYSIWVGLIYINNLHYSFSHPERGVVEGHFKEHFSFLERIVKQGDGEREETQKSSSSRSFSVSKEEKGSEKNEFKKWKERKRNENYCGRNDDSFGGNHMEGE